MTITPDTLREIEEKAKAATPGPWAYEGVSEKANDYRVGVVCPVLPNGDVGPQISGNVHSHPHWFDETTNEFGEWYCEEVAMLDEVSHSSDGGCGSDAAHIARMDPPTTLALVARIRELEGALKPFADEAPRYDPPEGDDNYLAYDSRFTMGDLRRAATAYKGG